MSLTLRLTSAVESEDPEDFLGQSLGVVFPDDILTQHGDASNALRYTSPHFPKQLHIRLADPDSEDERRLFSHYLWNASLMLAEFIEAGSLGIQLPKPLGCGGRPSVIDNRQPEKMFDIRGLSTIELGAGTALPSMISALLGAHHVVATDYPAPPTMEILQANVAFNSQASFSPSGKVAERIIVEGHTWGNLTGDAFATGNKSQFDRVLVCDCLWMPWQHDNLRKSISWFLKNGSESRAWIVAGFHTGRHNMSGFFDPGKLADAGLELESIWERDVDGEEREWATEREDDGLKKRWLVVAILGKAQSATDTGA
ncbi:putative Nicotinamide N-methyltransferase [Seiridium cardinale]